MVGVKRSDSMHPAASPGLPAAIVEHILHDDHRILLVGAAGTGKSTLAAALARVLAEARRVCWCLGADPGTPAFGLPGAVSLGRWTGNAWAVVGHEALCSLDAGRFRLPVVAAARRLMGTVRAGTLLVDGPGVVRGVAGAELLSGLIDAAGIDTVVVLNRAGRPPPLAAELDALAPALYHVSVHDAARRPGKRLRARVRTERWDDYLAGAGARAIPLTALPVLGTPPPRSAPSTWVGRQVALLRGDRSVAMGEVIRLDGEHLILRAPATGDQPDAILVRDAARGGDGMLHTAEPFSTGALAYLPPPDTAPYAPADGGPRPVGRVGALTVTLVNGVFGDPLLHVRLRHKRRSLLFDLGEGGRLPARVAHQVSDVFISHAHLDHIGGFLWLLRSRIGDFPACRVYGPPGMATHIDGLVHGILWDRSADYGPRFEVMELHGTILKRFSVEAGGAGAVPGGETTAPTGIIYQDTAFRVRAVTLDHGTPVLAFALEPAKQINIRKDRLRARGLAPGPWLGELKQRMLEDDNGTTIQLPDGTREIVETLAAEFALIHPGRRLVYATDLADTPANRARLIGLAKNAHTFFCEATFLEQDADRARRTGHLTARGCGEIAEAAGVARLIPFHFSRRYEDHPEQVYAAVSAACPRTAVPVHLQPLIE